MPASSQGSFGFSGHSVTLPDRLLRVHEGGRGPARIGPDEIADQNEIRTGGSKFPCLFEVGCKADTRRLEQFGPPMQPLGNRLSRRPLPALVRLAEKHVVGAG